MPLDVIAHIDPVDLSELRNMYSALGNKIDRSVRRGINFTAIGLGKAIAKAVSKHITLNQKRVQHFIVVFKAGGTRMEAKVLVSGPRIYLTEFKARALKNGVSYKILRAGGRKKLANAFIHNFHGFDFVWSRPNSRGGKNKALKGPSIPHVVVNLPEFSSGRMLLKAASDLKKIIDLNIIKDIEKL